MRKGSREEGIRLAAVDEPGRAPYPLPPAAGVGWLTRDEATTIERLSVLATAYVTGWIIESVQKAISLDTYL